MKVKCFVVRREVIETEIPNEYRRLAVRHPWEDPSLTAEIYDACQKEVEKALGMPLKWDDDDATAFCYAIHSAENDEVMMEAG